MGGADTFGLATVQQLRAIQAFCCTFYKFLDKCRFFCFDRRHILQVAVYQFTGSGYILWLETVVLIAILIISLVVLAAVLFFGFRRADTTAFEQAMKAFEDEMRSEFRNQRSETSQQSSQLREELNNGYKSLSDSLLARMSENLTSAE